MSHPSSPRFPHPEPPLDRADAIVVLGCRVLPDGSPSRALSRRLRLGARCYWNGLGSSLVVSGGRRWGEHREATVMRDELLALGIDGSAILTEEDSLTTRGNCRLVARLLRERGHRRVIVATCDWHFTRAARGFRRHGLEPVAPPASWQTTPLPSPWLWVRERASFVMDEVIAATGSERWG
ncbi:MAG: YdcF family protein [Myxococcales bacterium]|nr:YdcF family protein [Myxococcales bacterium]